MNQSIEINKLIGYIENHHDFDIVKCNTCFYSNHLGAVLADIILQAGLNYKTVVLPRVLYIYDNYKYANNLKGLSNSINEVGIDRFLNWKNNIKLKRFKSVLDYLNYNSIHTTTELVDHLMCYDNKEDFLSIYGIGNKTVDYFFKLMGVETIAVDRHIINFLNQANINFTSYYSAKKIVEYTADMLNISRRDIDYSIWNYMSEKSNQKVLELDF